MDINKLQIKYRENLLENVMPFWLKCGIDYEYGGYLTCLDRKGEVYSYEKSVWFQGRMLWTLSRLMKQYGTREDLKRAADCGYAFIKKCFLEHGRMPFIVTRDGRTIQKRRYYFSETFAAIALSEYYAVTGDKASLELGRQAYQTAKTIYSGAMKEIPKYNPETFRLKGFSAPMILFSTAQTMRENDTERAEDYNQDIHLYLADMKDFYKKEHNACFENVTLEGKSDLDSQKGRLLNPGHAIEGSWFLFDEYEYTKDETLKTLALDVLNDSFQRGWDNENGGLLSFVDVLNKPVEQLESDMKMWWPHCETLIAHLKAYRLTKDKSYLEKFLMVEDYTFSHFCDSTYGEWYGYLNKDGSVSKTLKGSMFKGPYHIPRCLMILDRELELLKSL